MVKNIYICILCFLPVAVVFGASCETPIDCYERALIELQEAKALLKTQYQQFEEQNNRIISLEQKISVLGTDIKDMVNHKSCRELIVNPRHHPDDIATFPYKLTKMMCPKNMYLAGVRVVNNSGPLPDGLPPIDRVYCCALW